MGKKGRELELCKEWGDLTDGSFYDDWLEAKLIATEKRMEVAEGLLRNIQLNAQAYKRDMPKRDMPAEIVDRLITAYFARKDG